MKEVLRKLLRTLSHSLPEIPFEIRYWDNQSERFGIGEPSFTIIFKHQKSIKKIFSKGSMGFAEEYVEGNIDVEGDFVYLVRLGICPEFQNIKLSFGTRMAALMNHLLSLNTLRGSARNIAHHYDLGNEFYRLYLDESMTYSCAYYRNKNDSLEDAQQQKYEHICRKLALKEGETLVDIGCGWGGMLLYAVHHYGVKGLGCTLSVHQADYAKKRVAEEGLEKSITILLEDYRNVKGQFDKYVSIGMFEHVGKGLIPMFMEKTKSILKPGGIGLLHTIGKERDTPFDPWTMKYIFPGGHLPALDHIIRTMGDKSLIPIDIENLRLHYSATLDEWAKRFEKNSDQIKKMFDERLVRTWRMYLRGSSAAFRWGDIRLYQILFTNGLNNSLPMTREHLYKS
ncbi:MAG: class I SAM-dependent methyltransferase [Syntrophorhabdus sp.]|jgi:cyclopropane-fatty-acyl-phospholipid synthase|nr:class I SAM-dependent methyltransferase [Syntrophorhabdus sp.]